MRERHSPSTAFGEPATTQSDVSSFAERGAGAKTKHGMQLIISESKGRCATMSEEAISQKIDNLSEKIDRKFNILQQEVREVRSLVTELVQDMKPDVEANREHLLKLERRQDRFNLRLEEVERKVAGGIGR
jgi:hypothetical protein